MSTDKAYKSEAVDQVRQHIDKLDDKMHDLLMERAELVRKIGEEKKKNNVEIVQPAREARMLRRLMARHKGPLPQEAVVRIWRELVGAVTLLQTGLSLSVTMPEGSEGLFYWDMARDYFGSILPSQKTSSPFGALGAVRDDSVTFAVLPFPQVDEKEPWWPALMDEGNASIRLIQCLPCGQKGRCSYGHYKSLVAAKVGFNPSDDDHSFIGLSVNSGISRAKIAEVTKTMGLEPLSLYTNVSTIPDAQTQHLLEVNDYFTQHDERLAAFLQKLEDPNGKAVCLGGYPAPLIYDKVSV